MIKRVRFIRLAAGANPDDLTALSLDFAERLAGAEADQRPARVVLCTSLAGLAGIARYDAVGIAWFDDSEHMGRFEAWLAGHGRAAPEEAEAPLDPGDSPAMVAHELVMRGQDWLAGRWGEGGEKVKHMAVARRARHLSPEEFSEMWRARAGKLATPGGGPVIAIPDDAKGKAYVQNHPLLGPGVDPPYDALNEVYFDDVEGLRRRIDWFAENLQGGTEDDLVSEAWFLAAREHVLFQK